MEEKYFLGLPKIFFFIIFATAIKFVFYIQNNSKNDSNRGQKHIYPEFGTILLVIVPNPGRIYANICGFCPQLRAYM